MNLMKRRMFLKIAGGTIGTLVSNSSSSAGYVNEPLTIKCFTPEGVPMPKEKLEEMIFYNPEQDPYNRRIIRSADGIFQSWLPDAQFCPAMPFPVTNFGNTWVHADNGGNGYSPATVPNPFHFNYECAQSRAQSVRNYVNEQTKRGCAFSSEMRRRLESAETMVTKASATADDAEKARISDTSLTDSMWAGEMAVFEKAQFEIKNRGYRPEFRIGCNAFFINNKYEPDGMNRLKTGFERLCNFATLPFYRSQVEKEKGIYDTSNINRILEWIQNYKITPKGHPLVWLNSYGYPPWMKDYTYEQAFLEHKRYVHDMVSTYRDKIKLWDVINEANDVENYGYSFEQLIEITRLAVDTAKEANPEARIIVNVNEPFAEYAAYESRNLNPQSARDIRSTQTYFRELTNANVNWDITGIQHYWYARDMFEMDKHLDVFSRFGKPIHITELGVASSSAPDFKDRKESGRNLLHWHGNEWTEAIQADWVEQFYTICYSKPFMEAIVWWDMPESFWFNGGLFRKDLTPKPSYFRLLKLKESWESMK